MFYKSDQKELCGRSGQKEDTENEIRIKIHRKKIYEMTQYMMVQPDIRRHQEGRNKLVRMWEDRNDWRLLIHPLT